jgi:hypothetical protein
MPLVSHGITHQGMINICPQDCEFDKPFEWNGRFDIISGHEWFDHDFRLQFDSTPLQDIKTSSGFKTLHGSYFWHGGIIYRDSNVNRSLALTRMTCVRKPLEVGLDDALWANQIATCTLVKDSELYSQLQLNVRLCHEAADHFSLAQANALAPHNKRALRVPAWNEIVNESIFFTGTWVKLATVKAFIKLGEWAKWEKIPRLINDLTVRGSLLGGYFVSRLKSAMTTGVVLREGTSRFIAQPDVQELARMFAELEHPARSVTHFFFSDDTVAAFRCCDGIYRCNIDISSCDGSHGQSLFWLLLNLYDSNEWRDALNRCIDQLMLPLRVRSCEPEHPGSVLLKPRSPVLYTGSVLTTVVNNFANFLIFHQLCLIDWSTIRVQDASYHVKEAAKRAGYLVTCVNCNSIEEMQFLKCSPCKLEDGSLGAWLNLGVILRTIGTCHGDLPGRGSLGKRSRQFDRSVLAGMISAGDSKFMRMLRRKYCVHEHRGDPIRGVSFIVDHLKGQEYSVSDEAIMTRYSIRREEYDELCELTAKADIGDCIRCSASDRILFVDYEYDPDVDPQTFLL